MVQAEGKEDIRQGDKSRDGFCMCTGSDDDDVVMARESMGVHDPRMIIRK